MKRPEQDLQRACVKWFNLQYPEMHGLLFMCHQNASSRIQQSILKGLGLIAGVSDLILLSPSGAVFIELKAGKNKQTDVQKEWQAKVEAYGYPYVVVNSLEQFIEEVKQWLPDLQKSQMKS